MQFAVDIEPEVRVETPYELPLWIIISAIVAGVLLLGIIILILWKVSPRWHRGVSGLAHAHFGVEKLATCALSQPQKPRSSRRLALTN